MRRQLTGKKSVTNHQANIYGIVVALAVFFVGLTTGMGGSFIPNLVFSILIGLFAAVVMRLVTKLMNKDQDS